MGVYTNVLSCRRDESKTNHLTNRCLKETKSATMDIFEIFYFLFKSFVKVELSYVFADSEVPNQKA